MRCFPISIPKRNYFKELRTGAKTKIELGKTKCNRIALI